MLNRVKRGIGDLATSITKNKMRTVQNSDVFRRIKNRGLNAGTAVRDRFIGGPRVNTGIADLSEARRMFDESNAQQARNVVKQRAGRIAQANQEAATRRGLNLADAANTPRTPTGTPVGNIPGGEINRAGRRTAAFMPDELTDAEAIRQGVDRMGADDVNRMAEALTDTRAATDFTRGEQVLTGGGAATAYVGTRRLRGRRV